jgi:hypothetical protein
MANVYTIYSGPFPAAAAQTKVATGTVIKTLLQVKLGTQRKAKIIEWGISFDGTAAATPIQCELIETGTVFATVTASVAADIVLFDDPNAVSPTTSDIVVGTTATGYNASAEGTVVASRLFDYQLVAPTNQYIKQFPLGREPVVNVSTALRVRVTASASVGAVAYIQLEV